MERKYEYKEKTEKDYIKEVEKINYKTALEAKKTLDSISRTTDKTRSILLEQREKLEDIRNESDAIQQNVIKGKELAVKMVRAGKLFTIGDKVKDKIKSIFKPQAPQRKLVQHPSSLSKEDMHISPVLPSLEIEEENPTEESTNKVLLSIRDGLKDLHKRISMQTQEITDQVPLIEEITSINKSSCDDAEKVMKNLKKI